jgi:hypothetical protein
LLALDAASGKAIPSFGENGQVDLTREVRITSRGGYVVTSPPAIINDLVVVGSAIGDNRGLELERGVVRAYDALTGKLRWSWDPIPQSAQDPARRTWAGESATKTGAANAWSIISADPQRDLLFIPTSSPSPGFLRRRAQGRQPLRQFGRGVARFDWASRLAFPGRASRRVGLRRGVAADVDHAQTPRARDSRRWRLARRWVCSSCWIGATASRSSPSKNVPCLKPLCPASRLRRRSPSRNCRARSCHIN